VPPTSIPDWLALVGDAADGYPGLPGWGAKSAAAVLERFGRLEKIPNDASAWNIKALSPGRAARLAETLVERRDEAILFRQLATLRQDVPLQEKLADLKWKGADRRLEVLCKQLGDERLAARVTTWR
jgi:5'-3' exonuclease